MSLLENNALIRHPNLVRWPQTDPQWKLWIKNLNEQKFQLQGMSNTLGSIGALIVPTEYFLLMVRRLTLTGTQHLILQGTARLRIT